MMKKTFFTPAGAWVNAQMHSRLVYAPVWNLAQNLDN